MNTTLPHASSFPDETRPLIFPSPMVLAVDDDYFTRALLRRALTNGNLRVRTFDSAQDLLENADLYSPAVLLLDVSMPDVSGLKLQMLLRERGVRLPVMFLTGRSNVAMAVGAMRNGAVDFVEKPFEAVDLVERVRHAFASHAHPPASPPSRRKPAAESENDRRLGSLTTREREVYDRMVFGMTSKLIASELGGSFRTIEIHRGRVMEKMGASNTADLVRRMFGTGEAH